MAHIVQANKNRLINLDHVTHVDVVEEDGSWQVRFYLTREGRREWVGMGQFGSQQKAQDWLANFYAKCYPPIIQELPV